MWPLYMLFPQGKPVQLAVRAHSGVAYVMPACCAPIASSGDASSNAGMWSLMFSNTPGSSLMVSFLTVAFLLVKTSKLHNSALIPPHELPLRAKRDTI